MSEEQLNWDFLDGFKAFKLIRLATPVQDKQLLIIYCSPKRQLPGSLYKSPGTARGPSPQAKISWRGEEEATEEASTTNHSSFRYL